ncbi:MAG: RteC domain-containing protein [Chitinophagaceae bacterium]
MINAALLIQESTMLSLRQNIGINELDIASIGQAIKVVTDAISRLNRLLIESEFDNAEEEIRFFKTIKSPMDGKLIFYLMLLRISKSSMLTSFEEQRNFYSAELRKLSSFYDKHQSFWCYIRLEQTYMDEVYFIRRNEFNTELQDELFTSYDPKLSPPMGHILSRLYAYEEFREFVSGKLAVLHTSLSTSTEKNKRKDGLIWTFSKIALIELIYAFQEYGVFNNGQADTKSIANYFSSVFQLQFGNIYKSYEDIRLRKKSPTPFLDGLKAALERRIDRDNE